MDLNEDQQNSNDSESLSIEEITAKFIDIFVEPILKYLEANGFKSEDPEALSAKVVREVKNACDRAREQGRTHIKNEDFLDILNEIRRQKEETKILVEKKHEETQDLIEKKHEETQKKNEIQHKRTRQHMSFLINKVIKKDFEDKRVDRLVSRISKEGYSPKKLMKKLIKRIEKNNPTSEKALEYLQLLKTAFEEAEAIEEIFDPTLKEKVISFVTKLIKAITTGGIKGLASFGVKEALKYL